MFGLFWHLAALGPWMTMCPTNKRFSSMSVIHDAGCSSCAPSLPQTHHQPHGHLTPSSTQRQNLRRRVTHRRSRVWHMLANSSVSRGSFFSEQWATITTHHEMGMNAAAHHNQPKITTVLHRDQLVQDVFQIRHGPTGCNA